MSETSRLLDSNALQTSIKTSSLGVEELATSSELLKERTELYKKQDESLKSLLDKLKLHVDEHGNVPKRVFEFFSDTTNSTTSAEQIILDQADKLKKQKYFKAKLLNCIRQYNNLNGVISVQIHTLQSELQYLKENPHYVLKFDCTNINELEKKVEKYRQVVNNYLLKNPWLKEESLEMPFIKKQLDQLESLREKKNALLQALKVYKGLEPDVKQAKLQLVKAKEEFLAADKAFML